MSSEESDSVTTSSSSPGESGDESFSDSESISSEGEDKEESTCHTVAEENTSLKKRKADEDVAHIRAQIIEIVTRCDEQKLGHVDKIVRAYAAGAVSFEKLQAKLKAQFGETIHPFVQMKHCEPKIFEQPLFCVGLLIPT